MTLIRDSLVLDGSGLKKTADGYLTGIAKVSRAGNVQQYYGHELGLTGDEAQQTFGVYRDPETVFNKDSMVTLAGRPVTINHPDADVTADNWKDLAVGHVGGSIAREGEHVTAPMVIMDAKAVSRAESGSVYLSAGYYVNSVREDGTAPDGTPYQFKQSGPMRFNHVALLDGKKPRAGNTKFGDSQNDGGKDRATWGASLPTQKGDSVVTDKATQIVRDGMSVSVPASDAQVLTRLFADADKMLTDMTSERDKLKGDIAKKQGELDALKADMKKLKDSALSIGDLDRLADDRATLKADAKSVLGKSADLSGKSSLQIKTAVLEKSMGNSLKGALEAQADDAARSIYIDAAYAASASTRKAQRKSNPISDAINDGLQQINDGVGGWDHMLANGEK